MPAKKTTIKKTPANYTAHTFPDGVSQPAVRALHHAGITTLAQLTRHREKDVADLHGMGPKALGILKAELLKSGRTFKA